MSDTTQAIRAFDAGGRQAMSAMLSPAEVAELLGCCGETVNEAARDGRLPGVKFGRSWRFPRVALDAALLAASTAKMKRAMFVAVAVAVQQKTKSRRSALPTLVDC